MTKSLVGSVGGLQRTQGYPPILTYVDKELNVEISIGSARSVRPEGGMIHVPDELAYCGPKLVRDANSIEFLES